VPNEIDLMVSSSVSNITDQKGKGEAREEDVEQKPTSTGAAAAVATTKTSAKRPLKETIFGSYSERVVSEL
jgi:hypothetical protein